MTFENSKLRVELDVSPNGVGLTGIQDRVTGVQYLSGRTSLFGRRDARDRERGGH